MGILAAIKWCMDHPKKKMLCITNKSWTIEFDNELGLMKSYSKGIPCTFDFNTWCGHKFEPIVIEKKPFKDLFQDWLDGEMIYGEYEDKRYLVDPESGFLVYITSSDFSKIYSFVDKSMTKVIFKQPIWYKEENYENMG